MKYVAEKAEYLSLALKRAIMNIVILEHGAAPLRDALHGQGVDLNLDKLSPAILAQVYRVVRSHMDSMSRPADRGKH